jgi:hypothetical protein
MLPAGQGSFNLAGSIPECLHDQQFAISANGHRLGRYAVTAGDFELRVPTPCELDGLPLRLKITATNFFRPSSFGGDNRRLAFLLSDIRWSQEARTAYG